MAIRISIPHPEEVFNPQTFDNLFNYDTTTEVYWGGASSGKSFGVVQKVIIKTLQNWKHPRRVLWLRKVGTALSDSIYADVKAELNELGLLQYCDVNKSNFKITLPNRAEYLFKGMDDPEKIKSITGISDIVMEEASNFNSEDYDQLMLRLRSPKHTKRQMFLMFNPVSKLNWTYKYFFGSEQPEDSRLIHSTYKDNKFLDAKSRSVIENMARTNPAYYKIYALGQFATLDRLVYPNFKRTRLNPLDPKLRKLTDYYSIDFGYSNDPSALIHSKYDPDNKRIYVMEEYVKKGMLNSEIADIIKKLGWSKEVITADAAEPKSIEEIRRDGVSRIKAAQKGPDSIRQGISFVQQHDLIVDDRCVKTIEELENYTYKKDKKTGEYTNDPVDSYNHCLDSLRYSLDPVNGHGVPKVKIFRNNFI